MSKIFPTSGKPFGPGGSLGVLALRKTALIINRERRTKASSAVRMRLETMVANEGIWNERIACIVMRFTALSKLFRRAYQNRIRPPDSEWRDKICYPFSRSHGQNYYRSWQFEYLCCCLWPKYCHEAAKDIILFSTSSTARQVRYDPSSTSPETQLDSSAGIAPSVACAVLSADHHST